MPLLYEEQLNYSDGIMKTGCVEMGIQIWYTEKYRRIEAVNGMTSRSRS